jgi:hypothetical protein
MTPKNSILTIRPYKLGSIWVFDYEAFDLIAEAFVGEINDMIDAMLLRADLPASEPFTALFSDKPFPGYHMKLDWDREEFGGNWYYDQTPNMDAGWLCPVLCMFFESAPANIYVRAEP